MAQWQNVCPECRKSLIQSPISPVNALKGWISNAGEPLAIRLSLLGSVYGSFLTQLTQYMAAFCV